MLYSFNKLFLHVRTEDLESVLQVCVLLNITGLKLVYSILVNILAYNCLLGPISKKLMGRILCLQLSVHDTISSCETQELFVIES